MSANWSIPNWRTSPATNRPRAARNVRSTTAAVASAGSRTTHLFQYAHLDVTVLQFERRTSARDGCRLLERARFEDDDSADRFLRLHERPFDNLPASYRQPGAGLIPELVRDDGVSAIPDRLQPTRKMLVHFHRESGVSAPLVDVGAAEQKHVLRHGQSPLSLNDRGGSASTSR